MTSSAAGRRGNAAVAVRAATEAVPGRRRGRCVRAECGGWMRRACAGGVETRGRGAVQASAAAAAGDEMLTSDAIAPRAPASPVERICVLVGRASESTYI